MYELIVSVLAGLMIVLLVVYDALRTTLDPDSGAGPMTSLVGSAVWSGAHRLAAGPRSPVLGAAGPVVLGTTFAVWMAGLVIGWSFVLAGVASHHLTTPDNTSVGIGDSVYFAVTTLFTLGPGDVLPATGLGQILTGAAAVNGLILVTLAITYVVPVVTAVTDRRIQAATLSSHGATAPEIYSTLREEDGESQLNDLVRDAATGIRTTAQRHLAYPVLHYFHSSSRRTAFAPSVAAFTEAVLAIADGSSQLHSAIGASYLAAVEELLDVTEHHIKPHLDTDPPRLPNSETAQAQSWTRPARAHDLLRRRLAALVADSGWSWRDAVGD